jgi:exonuclease VII small subunit
MALKLAQLQLQLNDKNKQLSKLENMVSSVESEKLSLEKRVFKI